jgi:hypothetical protein
MPEHFYVEGDTLVLLDDNGNDRLTLKLRPAKLQLRQPVVTRERERHGGSVLYSLVPKHEGHKP